MVERGGEDVLQVDAYVRVSRVGRRSGESFISPAIQREEIGAWAQTRGAVVLRVVEELDESGMRADRPLLEEVVRRVEEGVTHGFVVAKVDRFSRSLTAGMAAIERVAATGGTFFAVRDGLDTSTDSGRLVLRIMLSLAEWQMERIRTGWEQSREKAIARGAYLARTAPVGYRRLRSGRLRPDPITAPIVRDIFERRAAGASVPQLARLLEERGVQTALGNTGWSFTTTRGLLANRVYLGDVSWGPYARAGAHEPLTDPATWQAAQRPLRSTRPGSARPSLLAGLVRCAGCSMLLSPSYPARRSSEGQMYGCRIRSARGRCPAPASMAAHTLEPFVETVALELLARRRGRPDRELAAARARLESAEARLVVYRDADAVLASLGPDAFARGLDVRAERVRAARLDVAGIRARHRIHDLPPNDVLEREWTSMSIQERRVVVAAVIDCAFVMRGPGPVHERVTVCTAGTAPRELPRAGDKASRARPYRPRPRPAGARPWHVWTEARVERELRDYLADEACWPTRARFRADPPRPAAPAGVPHARRALVGAHAQPTIRVAPQRRRALA